MSEIPKQTEKIIDGVNVRVVGPIALWGTDICINHKDKEDIKEIIKKLAPQWNERLAGYFHTKDGKLYYHMSRYPHFSGEEVNDTETFRDLASRLSKELERNGAVCSITEEEPITEDTLRVIMGLNKGFSDDTHDKGQVAVHMKDMLPGCSLSCVDLLSAAADGECWNEECVRIVMPNIDANLANLVKYAEKFKQENYSIEYLKLCKVETFVLIHDTA